LTEDSGWLSKSKLVLERNTSSGRTISAGLGRIAWGKSQKSILGQLYYFFFPEAELRRFLISAACKCPAYLPKKTGGAVLWAAPPFAIKQS
jgi:hypothetical protein